MKTKPNALGNNVCLKSEDNSTSDWLIDRLTEIDLKTMNA